MHDSGPPAVRIDVPQCVMARLPLFAPAANLSAPLSVGLRAPRTMGGGGRSGRACEFRRRARQAPLPMLWRSHDHHRGVRAWRNATASADSANQPHQVRHLMTASQSCKSARRACRLSTGHGRARSDIRRPTQIVRQFIELDAAAGELAGLDRADAASCATVRWLLNERRARIVLLYYQPQRSTARAV